jgi:hypothetical protein
MHVDVAIKRYKICYLWSEPYQQKIQVCTEFFV